MDRDDRTFALFRLLQVPGVGPARLRGILAKAEDLRVAIADVVSNPVEFQSLLSVQQASELQASVVKDIDLWAKLRDLRVRVISFLDEAYPDSLRSLLGKQAPPLLFFQGNLGLLDKPSLGFCGSRKASEKGLTVAVDCSKIVSGEGINVVSGYAAGVDLATHRAALESGGTTTVILAEGISHFRIRRDLKALWDWDRALVVSQYSPALTWSVHNAMLRNDTICALCRAMVLIEARETGGSMEAGRTCLKLGIPLFAPVYEGMPDFALGNRILLKEGAKSFYKSRSKNLPNLQDLLTAFRDDRYLLRATSAS